MIYTVTFNPALDYVVRMEQFQLGQVNRTTSEEIQFGGKGINVSVLLKNIGVQNCALGLWQVLPERRWKTSCKRWEWIPILSTCPRG